MRFLIFAKKQREESTDAITKNQHQTMLTDFYLFGYVNFCKKRKTYNILFVKSFKNVARFGAIETYANRVDFEIDFYRNLLR